MEERIHNILSNVLLPDKFTFILEVALQHFDFPSSVKSIYTKPFPKRQILDSSKLKEFADKNFKLDENGRKFFKQLENTVGKGEIARYEQFLHFPQCFQKTYTAET